MFSATKPDTCELIIRHSRYQGLYSRSSDCYPHMLLSIISQKHTTLAHSWFNIDQRWRRSNNIEAALDQCTTHKEASGAEGRGGGKQRKWNNESAKVRNNKVRKSETTKVRNSESTKQRKSEVRNNESAEVRNNERAKQRKCETTKERNNESTKLRDRETTEVRNCEKAMRNNKRAMRNNDAGNNETAKKRSERAIRHYETTKGRNCERAMRKSEILKRF